MSRKRGLSVLVTVLFTDIVGSTEIGAELGDRRWRDLVRRHHAIVRRELKRFRGRELDTAGDGFFARFDRPADAIRCACAISDDVRELGIEIRAGLHLGEAEVLEHKVGGIAVNVGARVMGVAKGGEVLVSSTLRDAVAGSGFAFADHGTHRLKGIEGEWRLYEVTMVEGERRSLPLGAEEARTRREFGEALPVRRTRDRILAGAAGAVVVALVVAGILTNALGGEEPDAAGREGLTDAERSLLAVVPEGFRSNCSSSSSPPPNATASVDCIPTEMYSVTYASYGSAEHLRTAFEGFASPADLTNVDCARDPSARHGYTVNGTPAGEVACYVEEGTSISTTDSVIVWTDDELLVLGRAVRGDAADLTLYTWWTTETGPWDASSAHPEGRRTAGHDPGHLRGGGQGVDPHVRGRAVRGERLRPHLRRRGAALREAVHGAPLPSAPPDDVRGEHCPNYEEYVWRLRGERLSLDLVSGGCREYASVDIGNTEWISAF